MKILIASNGSQHSLDAARYATLLAIPANAMVTLLGVNENKQDAKEFQQHMSDLQRMLVDTCGCDIELILTEDYFDAAVLAETESHFYHLIVVGSQGRRRLGRLFLGSAAKRLARRIRYPLLIVVEPRDKIERILICTGGDAPGETDAFVGGAIGHLLNADVTMLHVMSQIALNVDSETDNLEQNATELMEQQTYEGQHLERTLDILREQGVEVDDRHVKIRHGMVLEEIQRETEEGDYDLVVIGAHEVPEDTPWHELRRLLQEDIADQILTRTSRPVLVVRSPAQTEWDDVEDPA